MLEYVEVGKIYRNKKNRKLYKAAFVGHYTETPMVTERMVGYVALYESDVKDFVRPYDLFCEKFEECTDEIYVILSKTQPEIVDFTYYTDLETVNKRVEALNKIAKREEYWYITMYSNFRNSENDGKSVPKNF